MVQNFIYHYIDMLFIDLLNEGILLKDTWNRYNRQSLGILKFTLCNYFDIF